MRFPKMKSAAGGSKNGDEETGSTDKVPTPKWQKQEKVKDPYRRQTTRYRWGKAKKVVPPDETVEDQYDELQQEAGDVQVQSGDEPCSSGHQQLLHHHEEPPSQPSSSSAVVDLEAHPKPQRHHKEQQTSSTSVRIARLTSSQRSLDLGQDSGAAGELVQTVQSPETGDKAGTLTGDPDVDEVCVALDQVLRPESEVGASLESASLTVTPTDSASLAASEDATAGGQRMWQRNMLARLTRARQRRDIRLTRKEIVNLQMLMEAVLKQHLALSREVETVKANLHVRPGGGSDDQEWEPVDSVEPLSLGSALAKLHSERQEEAASFARILATKEQELNHVKHLRQQVEALKAACREKDEELERGATAVVTLRTLHQAKMHESRQRMGEVLEHHTKQVQDLSAALARAEQHEHHANKRLAELERAATEHASQLSQLEKVAADYKEALDEQRRENASLASHCEELQARLMSGVQDKDLVISKLQQQLASIHAQREMESMSLSRALTDKEMHIGRLMKTNNERAEEHAARVKGLTRELRDKDFAIEDLKAQLQDALYSVSTMEIELKSVREDLENYRMHQEELMLIMSKALSARDDDVEVMDTMKEEHERLVLEHRNAMDRIYSQKHVETLSFNKLINEKDIMISNLAIEIQRLGAELMERDNHLGQLEAQHRVLVEVADRKQAENNGLLKTIEAMNSQQEESARYLNQTYAKMEESKQKMEFMSNELSKKEAELSEVRTELEVMRREQAYEVSSVRKELEELRSKRAMEADHFRKALHEKDVEIRELQDRFHIFREERDKSEKSLMEQLKRKDSELNQKSVNLENFRDQIESEFKEKLKVKDDELQGLTCKLQALEACQSQISSLEDQKQEIEIHNEALEKEVQERGEEIKKLRNSIQQMKTAHKERMTELKAKMDQVAELRASLKNIKCAKDEKTNEMIKEIEALKSSLDDEKLLHKQNLRIKQYEIDRLTSTVEKIKTDHEACTLLWKSKEEELQALLISVEEENQRNKSAMDRLKSYLQERDEKIKMLETEASKLTEELDSFKLSMREKDRKIQYLKDHLESIQNKDESWETKLKEVEDDFAVQIKSLKENESRLQKDLSSERNRSDLTQKKLDKANAEIENLVKDALRKRKEMKTNIYRLFNVIKTVTSKRAAEISALSLQLETANQRIQVLNASSAENSEMKDKLQKMVAAKEVEMKQLSANMTSCTNELKARQEAELLLRKELEDLRAKNDDLCQELSVRSDAIKACQLEEERLKASLDEKLAVIEEQSKLMENMRAQNEELRLQVSITQTQMKKTLQEHKAKMDQMTHSVQNARADVDSEIAVLKDTIAKLECEVRARAVLKDQSDAQYCAKIVSLEASLSSKEEDLDKMIDEHQQKQKELNRLHDSQNELLKQITFLQESLAQQEKYTKDLEDANNQMKHRKRENETRCRDLLEKLTQSQNAIREKDELLSSLRLELDNLKSGLSTEVKELHDSLSKKGEDEKRLSEKVKELKRELETQREQAARLQEEMMAFKLSEARAYSSWEEERAQLEREKTQAEEHLLTIIERTETEMRAAIEKSQASEREAAKQALSAKDAELREIRASLDKLKAELRDATANLEAQQKDLEAQRKAAKAEKDALARLLADKENETSKLAHTVGTLKTNLAIQKHLLLTIPEGRAFFGLEQHDTGLRDTREETTLSQVGDHKTRPTRFHLDAELQTKRFQKKHIHSMGEPERGSALKRTASEGDHLDIADLMDLSEISFSSIPSSLTLGNTTLSEASSTSSHQRSISALSRIA